MVFIIKGARTGGKTEEMRRQNNETLRRMVGEGKTVHCMERQGTELTVRRVLTRGDALEAGFPSLPE